MASDTQRRVESGRAEAVALDRTGGVHKGARIDDERAAGISELEGKLVVVAVPTAPMASDISAAHDRVQRTVPKDEVAAVGIRGTPSRLLRERPSCKNKCR